MKANPDDIEREERRKQALELRRAGLSYDEIARQLGYSNRSGAYKVIQTALEHVAKQPAKEALSEELDRLDALLRGLWAKARVGDPAAVDRVLRIMDRRARYLGLDQPTRQIINVITEDMVDAELRRLEEQLADRLSDVDAVEPPA